MPYTMNLLCFVLASWFCCNHGRRSRGRSSQMQDVFFRDMLASRVSAPEDASMLHPSRHDLRPNALKTFAGVLFAVQKPGFTRSSRGGLVKASGDEEPKRVVFLGTPEMAAQTLKQLLKGSQDGRGGGFEIVGVVSQPSRAKKKGKLIPTPVQEVAESEGLNLLTPATAKDEDFLEALAELKPDLCITAAYGNFLPQRFLDLPLKGTLNIHPSLLPCYRGAAPVPASLAAGDTVTGVSVAFTVLKMDAGPILRQVTRELDGTEQANDLLLELFETGTEQLLDALPSVWDDSYKEVLIPQDDALATQAPKFDKSQSEARFDLLSAAEVHNRVRAWGDRGVWTELRTGSQDPKRFKLLRTSLPENVVQEAETTTLQQRLINIRQDKKALVVTCGDGSVLEILKVQAPASKGPVDAKSFWNGCRGEETRWIGHDEVDKS